MGFLFENLVDEVRRSTEKLCNYWDTTTTYFFWQTVLQSSTVSIVLIVTRLLI